MSAGIHAVAIPKWGIEMVEGTVVSWLSGVGAPVSKGEEIVEIESDKIVNALESPASGVLRRQLVGEGESLKVGALIGVIADAAVSDDDVDAFIAAYVVPEHSGDAEIAGAPQAAAATAAAAPVAPPGLRPAKGGRVSPVVRRLAEKLGVDLASVTGTGTGGRITSDDVERAAAGGGAGAAAHAGPDQSNPAAVTPLSSMRRTIARRLVESKQSVPHFYLGTDIELDRLLERRAELNASGGRKVSINDLIVWAVSRALRDVPQVNAHLVDDEIRQFEHADVCIAVATDRGLLTPILRGADRLGPADIAAASAALVEKARSGSLERSDIDGGTFTVSNLGMFGVDRFDAIINPPQVAILALGRASRRVVVRANDETAVATLVSANLSCDHRVVDGALGGEFLAALRRRIESMNG